jgi:Spherulation-specific family 4/PEP-CTERM motif
MRTRPPGISRSMLFALAFTVAAILQWPAVCAAGSVGVLVPAYFYPGTGGPGGVGDGWAAMAAAAPQIPVTAIFNPNSGPQPGPPDPNYVSALTNLENAGGKVIAYVFTDDGNAAAGTVESQMTTYLTQYGSLIEGFFLDAMLVTPATLSYYQGLDSYIKGLDPSKLVVGNPGQPFLNGVPPASYLTTADVFNIFEGTSALFSSYPSGVNWFQSYPGNRFSNIVYDVPTSTAMLATISQAVQLNAGEVYVTDQTLPNPYAQLPSYWDQEVSAISSTNTPEPGTLAMLVVAGLVGWVAARRRADEL